MTSMSRSRRSNGAIVAAVSFIVTLIMAVSLVSVTAFAYTNNSPINTINAIINAQGSCFISLSTNAINFGQVAAGSNTLFTNNQIIDQDPNGNIAANVLLGGSNWIGPSSANFFVANTVWNPTNVAVGTANNLELFPSLFDTAIQIPAPNYITPTTSANVYFGLFIPKLTALGVYTQNIVLENSC